MTKSNRQIITITLWLAIAVVIGLLSALYLQERETEVKPDEIARQNAVLFDSVVQSAPRRGSLNPDVIIAEFGDFQCESCKKVSPILKQAIEKYNKEVQVIWIHTLNKAHPQSEPAAIASQCANEQNQFWAFHDLLFQSQDNLSPAIYNQIAISLDMNMQEFQTCLEDERTKETVRSHDEFARLSGVDATPYLNVNDETISGEFSFEELDSLIQTKL